MTLSGGRAPSVLPKYGDARRRSRRRGVARPQLLSGPCAFVGWGATYPSPPPRESPSRSAPPCRCSSLAAALEALFALKFSVDHIGRDLQVVHEADGGSERLAGAWFPTAATSPLFAATHLRVGFLNRGARDTYAIRDTPTASSV